MESLRPAFPRGFCSPILYFTFSMETALHFDYPSATAKIHLSYLTRLLKLCRYRNKLHCRKLSQCWIWDELIVQIQPQYRYLVRWLLYPDLILQGYILSNQGSAMFLHSFEGPEKLGGKSFPKINIQAQRKQFFLCLNKQTRKNLDDGWNSSSPRFPTLDLELLLQLRNNMFTLLLNDKKYYRFFFFFLKHESKWKKILVI